MFVNKMNGIKTTLLLFFSLLSMNAHCIEQKTLISLYLLEENENNQSIKISVQSILNQSGFIIKDANRVVKNLNLKKNKSIQNLFENNDILSEILDTEIMISLKLNDF